MKNSRARDQHIGTINRRAEEILQLSAGEVLKQDLRALPSPLGDMLFDTLNTGRVAGRHEIQLALRGLWLEVSTYPVRGEDGAPLGAVLVFEDLTAQKELLTQKRQVEQTQLLTRVVARIADEIKNPLVSINTFIELIGERYDDPDFRRHFSSVVRRDVRRLVEVFEKLAGLVTEGELNFTTVDVHTVVDDVVTAIDIRGRVRWQLRTEGDVDAPVTLLVDTLENHVLKPSSAFELRFGGCPHASGSRSPIRIDGGNGRRGTRPRNRGTARVAVVESAHSRELLKIVRRNVGNGWVRWCDANRGQLWFREESPAASPEGQCNQSRKSQRQRQFAPSQHK